MTLQNKRPPCGEKSKAIYGVFGSCSSLQWSLWGKWLQSIHPGAVMFPVGPCWRVVFNTDRQGFLPVPLWQGFIYHTSGLVNVSPLWQHLQFPSDRYPVTMVSYTGSLFTHEVCRSSRQREQVRTTKVPGVMEHLVLTLPRKPQWEIMFPCFPSPKADSCCCSSPRISTKEMLMLQDCILLF